MRRRTSGIITQASKTIPVKTSATTRKLLKSIQRSNLSLSEGRDQSPTRAGARTVAGVADAAGGALTVRSVADFSVSVAAVVVTTDCAGDDSATVVSTVGESVGTARAGTSSGLAGVPAAIKPREAITGAAAIAAGDSLACDVVASIPTITGAAAGLLKATLAPGIGLGSIAGLGSICADMTAAACEAGAGEPASAGLSIQPKS